MNEHWTTLSHGGACWWCTIGHPAREFRDIRLQAVTTAKVRGGLDHAPVYFCANCIMNRRSFSTIAKQVISGAAVTAVTAKLCAGLHLLRVALA